jgi:poly-D-alanine transfer protein DltD
MTTYTYSGTSTCKGITKVRFANDAMRVKVLAKTGHSNIDLIALPDAMTKEEAVAYLISIQFWDKNGVVNNEIQQVILDAQEKRAATPQAANKEQRPKKEPKKAKKEVPAKAITLDSIKSKKTAPKSTVTKAEIQAQLADMEEAPF